jgi:transcriptional regulator with XRE-family HTH domain
VRRRRDALYRAFGLRVRQLREARGWTQERLAADAGLDRSYVAGIETGLRNPSLMAIAKLSDGFNLTLAELFDKVERRRR